MSPIPVASESEKPRQPWPIDLEPSTTGPLRVEPTSPAREAYVIKDDLGIVAYPNIVYHPLTGDYQQLASYREAQALCLTLQAQRGIREGRKATAALEASKGAA